jgi:hypothetical protein
LRRQCKQLGTSVSWVLLVDNQTFCCQDIRDTLHALTGMAHIPRDLRDRLRLIADSTKHLPPGAALADGSRQPIAVAHEQPVDPKNA